MYSFSYWNQSVVPCPVLTVASWPAIQISQEAGQVVWYFHLFQNFPQFIVIHTVKGFGIVHKAELGNCWLSKVAFLVTNHLDILLTMVMAPLCVKCRISQLGKSKESETTSSYTPATNMWLGQSNALTLDFNLERTGQKDRDNWYHISRRKVVSLKGPVVVVGAQNL